MSELFFLPSFPPVFNGLALFGLILLAGLAGGCLAARTRVLPKITGYIVAGWLLGPGALNLLGQDLLVEARLFVDISLGLILFELGRRLDFVWLRHDRWLLATGAGESALSFGLMFYVLGLFGIPPLQAAMAAAIGIAVSPAVVMLVAHEMGADGPVTRRLLALTAMNNVAALLAFTALLPLVHLSFEAGWLTVLLHPLYRLAGSLLLGAAFCLLTLRLARAVGKQEAGQFILLVGMIVAAVGAAKMFQLSVMLTLLSFGILARNLDRRRDLMEVEFGYAGQLFFVVLFVVAGASLQWVPGAMAGAALAMVAARLLGKSAALLVIGPASGLSLKQAALLGAALTPMTGVALGMAQTVADIYPDFGAQVSAIVVFAVAVLNLVGPVATRLALRAAGEAGHENERRW
jgi:Kef-type K+ transport systems, membrane components